MCGWGRSIDFGVHLFGMIEYECGEIDTVGAIVATTEDVRRYRADALRTGTIENELEHVAIVTFRFKGVHLRALFCLGGRMVS